MTSARAKFAHYLSDFRSMTREVGAGDPLWLRSLRDSGWSRFNETGFPTSRRGNERWKYTNVNPIAKIDFGISEKPVAAPENLFCLLYTTPSPRDVEESANAGCG